MLYQLHTGFVNGYKEGQEPIIYLVSSVQAVDQAGIPYVYSDGHGIANVENKPSFLFTNSAIGPSFRG